MRELLGTPRDFVFIVFRTVVVYLAILVGFRLIGKREVGQLAPFDLALMLLIANAVQNAMVGENTSLAAGLLAAAIILGLDRGLNWLADRSTRLRDVIEGDPMLLVEDGHVHPDALRAAGYTEPELGIVLRQSGLLRTSEALAVYLERNGQLSVVPRAEGRTLEDYDPDHPSGAEIDDAALEAVGRMGGVGHRRRRRRPGRLSGTSY
jgi:uncharacterized membrane protein YcaP (DUF421 family)